jgi:malate dehydrogenase (oxaloacetate-decarboxylating)
MSLLDLVRNSKATVLIGVTAKTGLFSADVLTQMGKNDQRPVIFALSNPTSKSECTPEQAAAATGGRAIVATGSPFPAFEHGGKTCLTSQCNNMFIFPGMGLGALVSRASRITSKMFLKASKALSSLITDEQRSQNMLLPTLKEIRRVSFHVAKAVAVEARDSGLGRQVSDEEYDRLIVRAQWVPHYYPFRPQNGR